MGFEKEMRLKLKNLPDHREINKKFKPLRDLISHSLLETSSVKTFKTLIDLLVKEKPFNLVQIKKKYFLPDLKKERQILTKQKKEFEALKKSAGEWIKKNFSEKQLKELWEKHQSWLPRRYKLYKGKTSLQKIAADTLARFKLIKKI
ncbi:hypothetical protein FJZ41_00600 [Candidatus Shapirobacteria bacterium]|nr:hypothetical protein [Candidatus Shapirobacteria bacterium]